MCHLLVRDWSSVLVDTRHEIPDHVIFGLFNASIPSFLLAAFVTGVILINVLKQLLLKDPNKPPLVFHLVPFVGNTITYGIDPFKFFFACREKVLSLPEPGPSQLTRF